MTTKPEATPTNATIEDYRELYGRETVVFGLPTGRSYHWFQNPYVEFNEFNDGTRTALEREPTIIPHPFFR